MQINFLVSIIIPTYNRAHLIRETLDAIAQQSYTNWECFVVDDYSTDDTKILVLEYIKRDNRFQYLINERTKGAQGARNTGVLKAIGDFIQFFDSDNIMYSNHLALKIEAFKQNPDLDIVTSFSHVKNSNNDIIDIFTWITKGGIFEKLISQKTYVDTNSALIRKYFFDNYLLDENVISFQEFDLHLTLSKKANYGMVWEFLTAYYRREVDTISSDKTKEKQGEVYNLLKYKENYLAIAGKNQFNSRVNTCLSFNSEVLNYAIQVFPHEKKLIFSIIKCERRLKLFNKIKNKIYDAI
jgi:glycosyltransferase involved in cell wall biosynthesis